MTGPQLLTEVIMSDSEQSYLRDVQYRFPDRLKARSILHTRYGPGVSVRRKPCRSLGYAREGARWPLFR